MRKYLFKVFYLGTPYQGYQRQPSGLTVENFIEMAFYKAGYIVSFKENQYKGCSRTDAGVHAIGNTFTLFCNEEPSLPIINSYLPGDKSIIIWAKTPVDDDFNPRMKSLKHYKYVLPSYMANRVDLDKLYEFIGTHDFSNFIKRDGAGMKNPVNTIHNIIIEKISNAVEINIMGDRFGREQIRRMIGYLFQEQFKNLSPLDIIALENKPDIRPAPAEYLILIDITYENNFDFKYLDNLSIVLKKLGEKHTQAIQRMFVEYLTVDLIDKIK